MRPSIVRTLLICTFLGGSPALAQQIEDKLVIVTSFSKDVTSPFQQAFEKKTDPADDTGSGIVAIA